MSAWFDKNWINRLSISLEGFVWRSDNTANFRCPICGDSDTDQHKRRGYFYLHKTAWSMKCHNCGAAYRLSTFIKLSFPHLYQEYKLEKLKEERPLEVRVINKEVVTAPTRHLKASWTIETAEDLREELQTIHWLLYSTSLEGLPSDHEAVVYAKSRKINESEFSRIYWTENLSELVHVGFGIKDKYRKEGRSILPKQPRLFFVVKDTDGKVQGIQARSILEKSFLTLMFEEDFPKVFGLDQVDSKNALVFEAAFCSTFIPGSLALLGATTPSSLLDIIPREQFTLVFDNEPRSPDTLARMAKAIESGFRVAFWPDAFEFKDLNDYMKDNPEPDLPMLEMHLRDNTFSGIRAKMKLSSWTKLGATTNADRNKKRWTR